MTVNHNCDTNTARPLPRYPNGEPFKVADAARHFSAHALIHWLLKTQPDATRAEILALGEAGLGK